MSNFNEYGLHELTQNEGNFFYDKNPSVRYHKSGFLKSWIDEHITDDITNIIDIGAFDGGDSLRFSLWYPNAQIHTIEPCSSNIEKINKQVTNIRDNIKLHTVAMTSENGTLEIYEIQNRDNQNVQGSLFNRTEKFNNKFKQFNSLGTTEVEGITYDELCKRENITKVDVAHIDVEGGGLQVISGMNNVLPKLIYIEREGKQMFEGKQTGDGELLTALKERGFTILKEFDNDILLKRVNEI